MLVTLILFEEGFKGFYLLIFFGDSGLNFGNNLSLVANGGDVLLIGLKFEQEGEFLALFPHYSWVQIL